MAASQLHKLPADSLFVSGARVHMPFWPLPNRAALLDHFHAVTRDAPDEYTSALALTPTPVVINRSAQVRPGSLGMEPLK